MAYSKYYTQFQPRQRQQNNGDDVLEALRRLQEQSQQQQQASQPSANDLMNIGKMGKSLFGGSGSTGATNFANAQGGVSTAYSSPASSVFGSSSMSGAGGGMGAVQSPVSGGATSNVLGGMSGNGGASAAASSNPYGWIAAALLSANIMHNKDISSWSDSIKGKAGGNLIDYYQGKGDGNEHGFMSKILDQDGTVGQTAKGFTDFMEFDPKNAIKNTLGGVKSALKLKFF